ncbi:hypothetical protein SAMN04488134_11647 [Amphibacillus marinus]|uniref:SMODS-associated and fused to various effectors domain-containing protein n=1 Tax=Amphibacillus marinus TaxID=872970 RepID=A0A1H8TGT3_9BACI|nr:SAVED domain-containing protein [Amphibacillus marinus]SEO90339.1 hypothetical protein SAMN04488134_11647 [Amphibacillus marinus]
MVKKGKKPKRRQLTRPEIFHLWVACGGVCSFEGCNKRLIERSGGDLTNVGIGAHIIGHAKGSARHNFMEQYGYTQETLEDITNLMLMCSYHSKYIDDKHTRDNFPPDMLFEMKKKHEERVASWSETKKKKSIALIHKRLGGPVFDFEIEGETPHILLDAVEDQEIFNDFTNQGWTDGKERNKELFRNFSRKIKDRKADVGEIFPLSPIPLLVHLGSLLTDTVPISTYQYNREDGLWVSSNPGLNKDISLACSIETNGLPHLAVSVSVSGIVKIDSIQEVLGEEFDTLSFEINEPGLKRVLYKEDVSNIQARIKNEIENLLQRNDYEKIHLFYAGPAGLAIEIGRGINTNIWSEVCLYQYNNRMKPKYQYALSI